ncbi:unnamed protein product, partial [Phaeothamnion confervicola]
ILDPCLGLVDVLESAGLFLYQEEDPAERAIPKLCDWSPPRTSGNAVVSHREFLRQFDAFSEQQLRFVDWNNVVAAGGAVLAAVMPTPPGPLRTYYHTHQAYRGSDIDLFIYGVNEATATKKVVGIYNAVRRTNSKVFAVRSLHTITIVSEFPCRKIQIILRLYKTLAEASPGRPVLHGFDVDCCSVGFDGQTVWATNRAARAICNGVNVVDLSYRSPSYESRLFKYSKRGFAVAVPGLRADRLRPELSTANRWELIGTHTVENVGGLAKLVILDANYRK